MTDKTTSIRAARAFELYVRAIWPAHRLFVRHKIARRCVRCAASEKMLTLDAAGICDLCRSKSPAPPTVNESFGQEQKDLDLILHSYQGKGSGAYDALVLFSGGKDSAYLIKRMQQEHPGLRLLAYTIDNSFMSPVAKENIDEMLPKLNVDHLFVRPQREFYINMFRYLITHLNEQGGYGTVDFSDGEFMLDTARNLAAEQQIPLILCGYSRYQVQNGLGLQTFESPRETELSDRQHTAGVPLKDFCAVSDLDRWWHGSQWPEQDVARLLFPPFAWNLEETEIKKQVVKWGLIPEKGHSPIVTNHRLIVLLGVVDVHKCGYSSYEIEFTRMIRDGKADLEEWQYIFELLEYTSRSGMFVKPIVLESLAELGLTTSDVGIQFQ